MIEVNCDKCGHHMIICEDHDTKEIMSAEDSLAISRTICKDDRYKVLKRQGWRCNLCFCQLRFSNRSQWGGEVAHIDHIFPYSKRYDYPKGFQFINECENLQALCPECNLKKSKKDVN